MSKYLKTLQQGFTVRAAKLASDILRGWVSVVPAEEVEKFLDTHDCKPIGDTSDKILADLVKNGFSEEIMDRARELVGG